MGGACSSSSAVQVTPSKEAGRETVAQAPLKTVDGKPAGLATATTATDAKSKTIPGEAWSGSSQHAQHNPNGPNGHQQVAVVKTNSLGSISDSQTSQPGAAPRPGSSDSNGRPLSRKERAAKDKEKEQDQREQKATDKPQTQSSDLHAPAPVRVRVMSAGRSRKVAETQPPPAPKPIMSRDDSDGSGSDFDSPTEVREAKDMKFPLPAAPTTSTSTSPAVPISADRRGTDKRASQSQQDDKRGSGQKRRSTRPDKKDKRNRMTMRVDDEHDRPWNMEAYNERTMASSATAAKVVEALFQPNQLRGFRPQRPDVAAASRDKGTMSPPGFGARSIYKGGASVSASVSTTTASTPPSLHSGSASVSVSQSQQSGAGAAPLSSGPRSAPVGSISAALVGSALFGNSSSAASVSASDTHTQTEKTLSVSVSITPPSPSPSQTQTQTQTSSTTASTSTIVSTGTAQAQSSTTAQAQAQAQKSPAQTTLTRSQSQKDADTDEAPSGFAFSIAITPATPKTSAPLSVVVTSDEKDKITMQTDTNTATQTTESSGTSERERMRESLMESLRDPNAHPKRGRSASVFYTKGSVPAAMMEQLARDAKAALKDENKTKSKKGKVKPLRKSNSTSSLIASILSECVRLEAPPVLPSFDEGLYGADGKLKTEWRYDARYIYHFINHMFRQADLTSDCIIICLVYIERFLEPGVYTLTPQNLRPIVIIALLIAAKVWDDRGMWNIDAYEMFPDLGPLKQINEWERIFLGMINYDLVVPPGLYAKYYFLLLMHTPERKEATAATPEAKAKPSDLLKVAAKGAIDKRSTFDVLKMQKIKALRIHGVSNVQKNPELRVLS